MKETLRYLENAKEILKSVPVEDNTYIDMKPVREACGTAYLAILKALDLYFMKKGVDEKKLPHSVYGYRKMMRKYLLIHDGKLLREFDKLYRLLHIAGYYKGLLQDTVVVRDALKAAKTFIDKIG